MITSRKSIQIMAILSLILFGCKAPKELPTVSEINLQKYSGTWYEIARLPNRFEKGLECITANYTLKVDGTIQVINKGYEIPDKQKIKSAEGKAKVPDQNYPGRLKVSFFGPFYGNYYIIELDDNYQYVLVGEPGRKYLWILSRTKQLDAGIYDRLTDIAQSNGFDTTKLIKVQQDCNN